VPASLADKLAFLRSRCGPGDEAVETHFAWVFLVGERAYKLRKPVRRDPMDYGSIAARRADSESEVRLNRRLAPDVYLRTVALTLEPDGHLAIGGHGEIVDWLVEMRRLDRRWMLDVVLERCEFGRLDEERAARLAAQQRQAIDRLAAELDSRAARGCIVEAHGDLRPEHILVSDPPAVIDCLEFDRELRILDRAEELCFLELECGRIGHASAGRRLRDECLRKLADDVSPALLDFYRGHRAATRAKLYIWRASEPDGGTPEEWRSRASEYLDYVPD
jgi:aminoglycoside phosphotransferase family enzyme